MKAPIFYAEIKVRFYAAPDFDEMDTALSEQMDAIIDQIGGNISEDTQTFLGEPFAEIFITG